MPDGADAVVMVEDTDGDGVGAVRIFAAVEPGQNVGRQGADIQQRPDACSQAGDDAERRAASARWRRSA